jgi:hypothetical protein
MDRARRRPRHRTLADGPYEHDVTLCVAADGVLTELQMTRWGNPDKQPFAEHPFGATLQAAVTFDGFTIPSEL